MKTTSLSLLLFVHASILNAAGKATCPEKMGSWTYEHSNFSYEPDSANAYASIRIDLRRKAVWFNGHVGSGFRKTTCGDHEALHCFQTNRMSFAVPKTELKVGQSWTSFGRTYTVTHHSPFSMLGVNTTVFAISGDQRFIDTKSTYYYSSSRGLLAVRGWSESERRHFFHFSTSGIGYPVKRCAID